MPYYIIALIILLVIGCRNKADTEEPQYTDTIAAEVPDTVLAWRVDAEELTIMRDSSIHDSILTINRIINGLNSKYPRVQIRFLRQSGDTLYMDVPDANVLGEQMGSAGATAWFADAVINLTSIPGINYVSFQMEPHSHAQSAVISKEQYSAWKQE